MKRFMLIACGLLIAAACSPTEDSSTLAPQFDRAKVSVTQVPCTVVTGSWFAVKQGDRWKVIGDEYDGWINCSGATHDLVINGGDGVDLIIGGPGDDVINGGGGNDDIYGLSGNDALHGGDDDDCLYGGNGIDQCIGGAGSDDSAEDCEVERSIERTTCRE